MMRTPRTYPVAPTTIIPRVTAGLNKPPLMRKKTHALTASDMPNTKAMYMILLGLALKSTALAPSAGAVFTTLVPPNANRRNMKVPTNSPTHATIWPLTLFGRTSRNSRRLMWCWWLWCGRCLRRLFHGIRRPVVGRSTFMVT